MYDQRTDEIILLVGSLNRLRISSIRVDAANKIIYVTLQKIEGLPTCTGAEIFDWYIEFLYEEEK